MYEVEVFNRINKVIFIKKFNSSERLYDFVRKVKYSKTLTLLSIRNYSYLYD